MSTEKKKPLYQIIGGIRSPATFSPVCFKEALTYKPQPSDNFIVTYPKSGTTWMQNIALFIYRKGHPLHDYGEFHMRCPFLDHLGLEGVNKMPRPGAIKTHLPFNYMPYSPEAKYIIVARNPRDVCVSLYHHTRVTPGLAYLDGKFDDFFELFINGEVEYNDYFDHLLSWYPHRNDKNIYYTTYEKMKSEIRVVVQELAKFLGDEYIEAIEKDNSVMNNILNFTNFQYMKEHLKHKSDIYKNRDSLMADPNIFEGTKYSIRYTEKLNVSKELPQFEYVRKGIIGDWKFHFSQEQLSRLNDKSAEKFKGTDLGMWWTY